MWRLSDQGSSCQKANRLDSHALGSAQANLESSSTHHHPAPTKTWPLTTPLTGLCDLPGAWKRMRQQSKSIVGLSSPVLSCGWRRGEVPANFVTMTPPACKAAPSASHNLLVVEELAALSPALTRMPSTMALAFWYLIVTYSKDAPPCAYSMAHDLPQPVSLSLVL